MSNETFDPEKALGIKICKMDRQELCEFVSALCRSVSAEVGTKGRRGGIFPDNICISENGNIVLGPAARSGWSGQELDFIAPEQYWNGQLSAASDVYSVGLLLYYAVNDGKLPFEGECDDAQLRRMGGDEFPLPDSAGHRLGEIIAKAVRFKAPERYQTLEELRLALDDCLKNLYMNELPNAEALFEKSDDDLDDVERMMVGIIEKSEPEEVPAEAAADEPEVRVYAPGEKSEAKEVFSLEQTAMLSQKFKAQSTPAAPMISEEHESQLKPVNPSRKVVKGGAAKYAGTERERKIAEEVKKRRRRPFAVILVLCAVLIMVAIVMNAMLKDFQEKTMIPDNQMDQAAVNAVVQTMPPAVGNGSAPEVTADPFAAPLEPETPEEPEAAETPAPTPVEHSYQVVKEDCSWTEAQRRCSELGGHLIVINDEEEFNAVVALAEANGITRVWIGCHRVNGSEVWENGTSGYIKWAKGEPTYVDTNDQVAEDYLMLWNHNGWAYNDNRDDPCKDYPQMYSGTMGYICEFGD